MIGSMGTSSDGMTRLVGSVLVMLVALVGYGVTQPHSTFAAVGTDAEWDAAVAQSRSRNMPGVVLYTADWCPACQALHAGALADPAVWRELGNRHTFVVVDLTRPAAAAQAHAAAAGVHGIPTLIRYDRDGRETDRTHGLPAVALIDWLQR